MARSPKNTGPEEPDEDTPPMPAEDSTVLEQETLASLGATRSS